MRLVTRPSTESFFGLAAFIALCALLTGCPEKGGATGEKTNAEPEHQEPDDQGQIDDKPKKPAAVQSAAPADDKKPDEAKDGKEEGGW